MRAVIPLIVWGESYIDDFLATSLPTFLAPGNLPAVVKSDSAEGSVFRFYTTTAGRKRLQDSDGVKTLSSLMPVTYEVISGPAPGEQAYEYLKDVQKRAIYDAAGFDLLFFLCPDFVLSDGALAFARDKVAAGYTSVISMVPRISAKACKPLASKRRRKKNGGVSLASYEVARACVEDEANLMEGFHWESHLHEDMTSWAYWKAGDEGWLFHAFHQHPLVLRPNPNDIHFWRDFINTVDVGYLPWVCRNFDKVFHVENTDDVAICSVATEDDVPNGDNVASVYKLWSWAEGATTLFHRVLFRKPVYWNVRPVEPEKWQGALQASAPICDEITMLLNTQDIHLKEVDPTLYKRRQKLTADVGATTSWIVSPCMAQDFPTRRLWGMLFFRFMMDVAQALRATGCERLFQAWRAVGDFFWMRTIRPDIRNYHGFEGDKNGIAYVDFVRNPDMNSLIVLRVLLHRLTGRGGRQV